jgi:hypothetical protein
LEDGSLTGGLDRQRIDAVADGRATSLDPITLDRTDGMLNTEGSGGGFDPSGLRDSAGRLWFSTIDGIVLVDPATFAINRIVPKVLVESMTLGGQTTITGSGQVLRVPPGTSAIELAYTSFSLIAPHKARFRYRLNGFDTQWQVGSRRTAYFSRLPPGEYVFEVAASNNDGVWSTEPATARLVVQRRRSDRHRAHQHARAVGCRPRDGAVQPVSGRWHARRVHSSSDAEDDMTNRHMLMRCRG